MCVEDGTYFISTHAPAGGATRILSVHRAADPHFYSRPCGRGDPTKQTTGASKRNFYSRPCGRGDEGLVGRKSGQTEISTHAPAGGATSGSPEPVLPLHHFYSRPCGRGDLRLAHIQPQDLHFYSRPCGRGDHLLSFVVVKFLFISTHAPAGGATLRDLLCRARRMDFYSRPCGRGDVTRFARNWQHLRISTHAPAGGATDIFDAPNVFIVFLLTPLREGRPTPVENIVLYYIISTHAPAGGATAIFHKSVMRFCGKLPKDDTVLCLASFGFPRRDPKAVYLAWISCANLPQKCAREGLALKDQGTSCFHEGLASHAFDPVLV